MFEQAEPDQLHRAILLQGCRHALRNRRTFHWWLSQHRTDLVALLHMAQAGDPNLLVALHGDERVRRMLSELTHSLWQNARQHPDATAMDALVAWALCATTPRMSRGFSQLVAELMAAPSVGAAQAACYRELVGRLRNTFSLAANHSAHSPGWPDLLCNAATALDRAHDPIAATALADEAWRYRDQFPTGTTDNAKGLVRLAIVNGYAVSHLPRDRQSRELFDLVLDRLAVARTATASIDKPTELAKTLVDLAISESQVWYVLKRQDMVGTLTAAQRRVEVLSRAEADMWRILSAANPDTVVGAYPELPADLRVALTRLLSDLANVAKFAGHSAVAVRAARDARAITDKPHHRLNLRLTTARVVNSIDERLRQDESLLRDIHAGALDQLSEWQRRRFDTRLHSETTELVRDLHRAKKSTAAWFWHRQGQEWISEATPLPRAATPPEPGPSTSDEIGSAQSDDTAMLVDTGSATSWLANVMDCLRRENVPGLVLCLMRAARGVDEPLARVIDGLTAADKWRPPRRRALTSDLVPEVCRTHGDAEIVALQLAAEFTESYVEYLSPRVRMSLAHNTALPWQDRWLWADRALRVSVASGRWLYALRALNLQLELAAERSDDRLVEQCVSEIQSIVRHWVVSATGTADLIDVTNKLLKRSTRTAALLASAGYARLAFDLARSAVGLISRIITEAPYLAAEFELAERRANGSEPHSDNRLFELMRDRILGRLHVSMPPECTMAEVAARYHAKVSFIQLLSTADLGCWALGWTRSDDGEEHWAARLPIDAAGLSELRATVWSQLRPARAGRTNSALGIVDDEVVRFVRPFIKHSDDVVFVPHGGFGGLPLHAARGPHGYLIEHHRVGYLPNLDGRAVQPTLDAQALVAGWDPEIHAGVEAAELSATLAGLGLSVVRPPKAVEGRRMLLDSDGRWGLVHVAAHGHFRAWPESMGSRLALSSKISVAAGDWLRSGCRAQFVFINACSLGRHSPHAGDLNGFPLAIRARGAVTEVSALSPVPSLPARAFARLFYERWPGRDSLRAYQHACLEAIRRGTSPSGWAPYLHSGAPVRLPARKPVEESL